jgi:hypothetical protein
MRRLFLLVLFLQLFIPGARAMTYANEPGDFYGLPWGLSAAELTKSRQQFVLTEDSGSTKYYACPTRSHNFYGAAFDKVRYAFFQGRFFLVQAVKANTTAIPQELYSAIVKQHGRPTQENDYFARKVSARLWQGDKTFIVLSVDFTRREATLSFYNYPLYQAWSARPKQAPAGRVRER